MSCTNPLKAFVIGKNPNGKNKLKITSRDVTYLERVNHSWLKRYDDFPCDVSNETFISKFDYIPCGSCLSCRLSYARDWTIRCMCHAQTVSPNYFITLTYDDNTIPFNVDIDTGELSGKSTLVKSDLQKFFKRLRESYPYDNHISYFSCGEYGSHSLRPHYHTLVFGLKVDDLKLYKKSPLGYNLYTSEYLSRVWNRGFVIVADVTWESASYVARYVMKKQKYNDPGVYDDYLIEPEFTTMSLKPAIGLDYYNLHKDDIYRFDAIYFPDGKIVKPPKYFDVLFERENPGRMKEIKDLRKMCSDISLKNQLSLCDYDFDELMLVKDYTLNERTKKLIRKEI